jgi:hypothetical protein
MLIKNIFGIIILLLNTAGLGYLFYLGTITLMEKISSNGTIDLGKAGKPLKKKPQIHNDNIVPDEDDLLKDMDLSDLDNLNLDDFE